jgi:hypothetical protein
MYTTFLIFFLLWMVAPCGVGFFANWWAYVLGDPHRGWVKQGRFLSGLGRWLFNRDQAFDRRSAYVTAARSARMIRKARERWQKDHGSAPFPADHPVYKQEIVGRVNWWKAAGVSPWWLLAWLSPLTYGFMCHAQECFGLELSYGTLIMFLPWVYISVLGLNIADRARQ